MRVLRWSGVLIGQLGLGLLVLKLMSTDPQSRVSSTPVISSPRVMVAPTAAAMNQAPVQEWTLQIDEASLTQELNTRATGLTVIQTPVGSARLHNLTVQLGNDELVLRGVADTGRVAESVALHATGSISAGRVLVQVGQAQVGGVDLPETVRHAVQDWLQQQLDEWLAADDAVVNSVEIRTGRLVVSGTRR